MPAYVSLDDDFVLLSCFPCGFFVLPLWFPMLPSWFLHASSVLPDDNPARKNDSQ